jgi:hypothetical protein
MERGEDRQPDDIEDPVMDPEGGTAHLAEVIAVNTLKEIIADAKVVVVEEEGDFHIPAETMDRLLVRCEKVMLNYGEDEAKKVMMDELRQYLNLKREFKEREDERKVRDRMPDDYQARE